MIRLKKSRWAWVESGEEIERELQILEPVMDILKEHGYSAAGIRIGGGCDEYDTGYESFFAEYETWEDCRSRLRPTFENEKAAHEHGWYTNLNFNFIEIGLTGKIGEADLIYDDYGVRFESDTEDKGLEDALKTELLRADFTLGNMEVN